MPYILEEDRDKLASGIEALASKIRSKGELNYAICELVGKLILKTGISYTKISEWIDAVHGAERELTRRILDPYEDIKTKENKDVQSFKDIITRM
jgi:hypothetical protein